MSLTVEKTIQPCDIHKCCIRISDEFRGLTTAFYPVPKLRYNRLTVNSLYCGKWRNISQLRRDLDPDQGECSKVAVDKQNKPIIM